LEIGRIQARHAFLKSMTICAGAYPPRLPQAAETTAANTVAATPRPALLHPGVQRYLREAGLLR
jgi:hypothetical protein